MQVTRFVKKIAQRNFGSLSGLSLLLSSLPFIMSSFGAVDYKMPLVGHFVSNWHAIFGIHFRVWLYLNFDIFLDNTV